MVPQEIVDLIVSHCDRRDTPALALVARAWRAPAQKRLFSIIELVAFTNWSAARNYTDPQATQVRDVESLLCSLLARPRLLSFVTAVSVTWCGGSILHAPPFLRSICRYLNAVSLRPLPVQPGHSYHRPNDCNTTLTFLLARVDDKAHTLKELSAAYAEISILEPVDPNQAFVHDPLDDINAIIPIDTLVLYPIISEVFNHDSLANTLSQAATISSLREINIMVFPETRNPPPALGFFANLKTLRISKCDPPGSALTQLISSCPRLQAIFLACRVAYDLRLSAYQQAGHGFKAYQFLTALNRVKQTLHELDFRASYDCVNEPFDSVKDAFTTYKSLKRLRMPIDFLMKLDVEDPNAAEFTLPVEQTCPIGLERLVIQTNPSMEWYDFSEEGFAMREGESEFFAAGPEALRIFDWLRGMAEHSTDRLPNLKSLVITAEDNTMVSKECPVRELRSALQLIESFAARGICLRMR